MINITRRQKELTRMPSFFEELAKPLSLARLSSWGGWDPFREMAPLFESEPQAYLPAFEVKENKEGFSFKADLPGVKEDDLKITLSDNRLSISGKREEEKKHEDETYYCHERTYGSFNRVFTLPEGTDADRIKAELKGGQLSLFVPKKAGQKEVTVKVNGDKTKS